MSWDDPFDDPRKELRKWFGDMLPEEVFRQIEEMMERMMEQLNEDGMFDPDALREFMENPQGTNPFVFGFQMSVGPDGKPTIQRFGNPTDDFDAPPHLEPLVDVIDEGDDVIVVAELPGVEKDEINVKIKGTRLTIHVENPDRPYHKEIELPSRVRKDEAKSSIRNGVLEVRLKKA